MRQCPSFGRYGNRGRSPARLEIPFHGEILELARALVGAEVTGRKVPPPSLFGMKSDELRDAAHHTSELYGVLFMYPDVRQGPVSGRGDEMQDVFFFTKEAIDSYFKGRVFAVSVVAGAAMARRA